MTSKKTINRNIGLTFDFLRQVAKDPSILDKIADELEEVATAKWIDEGMKSEDVSEKEIFELLRKRGVKI